MARRKTKWSYNTGERGRNWVRAYCKGCKRACARSSTHTRDLYLEWREETTDPTTGERRVRRRSTRLDAITDVEEAKREADNLAARFGAMAPETGSETTLAQLMDCYLKEATPNKGESKQGHDRRARRVWNAFLNAQPEAQRQGSRQPGTLDRLDWERFLEARRNGRIPGWNQKVRNKIILDDLAFMVAVLNWAVGASLLDQNPWDGSIRRVQGWPRVKELNPHRPGMQDWMREKLIQFSSNWQFGAALILERETRRRNKAIRHLNWSDLNLETGVIVWRAETDKRGRANETPLTEAAIQVFRQLPSRGIGQALVFPSVEDPSKPSSRHAFQQWLKRAKRAWLKSIEDPHEREGIRQQIRGIGYHSEKRSGVRDPKFRELPAAIQEEIAGTNYATLRKIYDKVTVDDIRQAWSEAKQVANSH